MVFCLAVSGLEVLKWFGYFLVALLCLMLMIMLHELGHYTFGKIFKFKINEFSIGFGPKLFSKTNKKTGELFSIRGVPLGGFCSFAGEDEEGESDADFNKRPVWQRIIVLFAGAGFNFLSAFIVITIFFSAYGEYFPVVGNAYQHVEYVEDGSYSIIEGSQQLKEGDIIMSVNGKNCYSLLEYNRLSSLISKEDDSVEIVVIRDGAKQTLHLQKQYYVSYTESGEKDADGDFILQEQISSSKGLGISMGSYSVQKLSAGQAFTHGAAFGYDVLRVTVNSVKQIFNGSLTVGESMGGTATAIFSLAQLVQAGIPAIIYGFCILSMSIGIMNILPLPALDGSRIVFAIIEGI
ncbi:MAG: site-2 protease family protein, partial [Clostridia bacterium]|nr:site-2 protease family protein [Clostridia bacterium]